MCQSIKMISNIKEIGFELKPSMKSPLEAIYALNEVMRTTAHMYFNEQITKNSLAQAANYNPDDKLGGSSIQDVYCDFLIKCLEAQRICLNELIPIAASEMNQKVIDISPNGSTMEYRDKEWLSIDETVSVFGLPRNNIKSRQWRIDNKFPYDGFDQQKGAYAKVIFHRKDVEQWLGKKP